MMPFPLIEALKPYGTDFNEKYDLLLPTNTPYGNFILTYTEIVVRIECLNELIITLYEDFGKHKELIKERGGWSTPDEGFKQKFYIEEVFYWLRKSADEFISMIFILNYFKINGIYPTKIDISSIGKLLGAKEVIDQVLNNHFKFLTTLNNISNGFKHSLINAQTHGYRGIHEPVVFALVAFNTVSDPPSYHQISLRVVLNEYNLFLIDVRAVLEGKYQTK